LKLSLEYKKETLCDLGNIDYKMGYICDTGGIKNAPYGWKNNQPWEIKLKDEKKSLKAILDPK
jgi:hypothetical protein